LSTTSLAPATSTLSLHDALPIYERPVGGPLLTHRGGDLEGEAAPPRTVAAVAVGARVHQRGEELVDQVAVGEVQLDRIEARLLGDRKSTRLNSSHVSISYAVFCL